MSRSALSQCNGNGNYVKECLACERMAGWAAVYANLALALFKAFIGLISGSMAILGDALFPFQDFIAALIAAIGAKVSGKPADEKHPYGHGKIEFVALFLVSIFMIIATIFLFVNSATGLWHSLHGTGNAPKMIAFWAALISVAANYKLAQYLRCVGNNMQSISMLAGARLNYSAAVSSIMVVVAVLGAHFFDLLFLDPLVALIEAICLMAMNFNMLIDSLKGLFDSAVPTAALERIESIARLVPGVIKVYKVTARRLGQGFWIDMTIKIDHALSHQNGYLIGRHVKESIQAALGSHTTVNVIIEPYIPYSMHPDGA
ncbi:MAG: cation diffusion facilitator family transporter [Desulfuromonadales bacterium]